MSDLLVVSGLYLVNNNRNWKSLHVADNSENDRLSIFIGTPEDDVTYDLELGEKLTTAKQAVTEAAANFFNQYLPNR